MKPRLLQTKINKKSKQVKKNHMQNDYIYVFIKICKFQINFNKYKKAQREY